MRRALLVLIALASCGSISPEERAAMAKVQLVTTDPVASCQNLGTVFGSPDGLRLRAIRLSANTVRLDAGSTSSGAAFYCPPGDARQTLPPIVHP